MNKILPLIFLVFLFYGSSFSILAANKNNVNKESSGENKVDRCRSAMRHTPRSGERGGGRVG